MLNAVSNTFLAFRLVKMEFRFISKCKKKSINEEPQTHTHPQNVTLFLLNPMGENPYITEYVSINLAVFLLNKPGLWATSPLPTVLMCLYFNDILMNLETCDKDLTLRCVPLRMPYRRHFLVSIICRQKLVFVISQPLPLWVITPRWLRSDQQQQSHCTLPSLIHTVTFTVI